MGTATMMIVAMMMIMLMLIMPMMMILTSLAPEYPLGVVRPKPESTLSIGAPLLDGIASLIKIMMLMMVMMMVMVVVVIMVIMMMNSSCRQVA